MTAMVTRNASVFVPLSQSCGVVFVHLAGNAKPLWQIAACTRHLQLYTAQLTRPLITAHTILTPD